jgi:hypothetical protein
VRSVGKMHVVVALVLSKLQLVVDFEVYLLHRRDWRIFHRLQLGIRRDLAILRAHIASNLVSIALLRILLLNHDLLWQLEVVVCHVLHRDLRRLHVLRSVRVLAVPCILVLQC